MHKSIAHEENRKKILRTYLLILVSTNNHTFDLDIEVVSAVDEESALAAFRCSNPNTSWDEYEEEGVRFVEIVPSERPNFLVRALHEMKHSASIQQALEIQQTNAQNIKTFTFTMRGNVVVEGTEEYAYERAKRAVESLAASQTGLNIEINSCDLSLEKILDQ